MEIDDISDEFDKEPIYRIILTNKEYNVIQYALKTLKYSIPCQKLGQQLQDFREIHTPIE